MNCFDDDCDCEDEEYSIKSLIRICNESYLGCDK